MPAKSQKQARAMRAAAHGSTNPTAKKIRASMSPSQIKDFEHTAKASPKKKPIEHEAHAYNWRNRNNLKRG